jgi:diadenosine tetraphosphate (Ap4A) HIT family hydrolase
MMARRQPFDLEAYERRVKTGGCFVCRFVSGEPGYEHEEIYADDACVALLSRYPTQFGYSLVVPREHIVDVTGDRRLFRHVTDAVYDLAEAMKQVLPVERVYLASLGSLQGNAHVHWHVVPLPPGVPYADQQFHAMMAEHGVIGTDPAEMAVLAQRLGTAMRALRATR